MKRNQVSGTVFRAICQPSAVENAWYVFVPDLYFDYNEEDERDPATIDFSTFDAESYSISRWPALNGRANGCPQSVRLMPDLVNLLPDEEQDMPAFHSFKETLFRLVLECSESF